MSKVWKFIGCASLYTGAACIALTLAALPTPSLAQDVVFEVSTDDLTALTVACETEATCAIAIRALIQRLVAENPDMPIETVIGAVAGGISDRYNNGTSLGTVAANILTALSVEASARNLPQMAAAINVAQASVVAGNEVAFEAFAFAQASPS